MKLALNRPISRGILILYIGITFFFRFAYESTMTSHYWLSLLTGIIFLSLPYALIKVGVLNPSWFWFEKEFKKVTDKGSSQP